VGIHHIAIGVPDLARALVFYTQALGFEQVERTSFSGPNPAVEAAIGLHQPTAKMAMLRGGNAHIELWQYEQPQPRDLTSRPSDFGYPHFALEVKDIDAEYSRLCAAGMEFVGPPVHFGDSAAVYGNDPFGNVIEIYEIDNPERAQIANTPLLQSGKLAKRKANDE
jgi:glyoxylase I family protein